MADASNLILVVGAVMLFGIILTSTLPVIYGNQRSMVNVDQESQAVELAEEMINIARGRAFNSALEANLDDPTWPDDFSDLGGAPDDAELSQLDGMDHFHGYADTVRTDQGNWRREVELQWLDEVDPDVVVGTGPSFHKQIRVTVESLDTDGDVELVAQRTSYLH